MRSSCARSTISRALAGVVLAAATLAGGDSVEAILDAFGQHLEGVRDLRARFVQTSYVASLGREDISRGRLLYLRPGRLRWEIEDPEPQVLVADGETLRMFSPEERVLQIAPLEGGSISQTALGFLLGDADIRGTFEVERLAQGAHEVARPAGSAAPPRDNPPGPGPNEGDRIGLLLTPRGDASFERLEAWLDRETLTVSEMTIFDLLGNRTHLQLVGVEENVGLEEGNFTIQVPDDTEVIDLR